MALSTAASAALAVWLMGWPTPPRVPAHAAYFVWLFALAGAAVGPWVYFASEHPKAFGEYARKPSRAVTFLLALAFCFPFQEAIARGVGLARWPGPEGPVGTGVEAAGDPLPIDVPDGAWTLALGDTVTAGRGVMPDETWPSALQRAGAGRVVGVGLVGANLARRARWLGEQPEEVRPKRVIVQLALDDAALRPYPVLRPGGPLEAILRRSHLYFYAVKRASLARLPLRRWQRRMYAEGTPSRERYRLAMKALGAEIRRRGARPVAVLFPPVGRVDAYAYEDLHAIIAKDAREAGFVFVDLLETMRVARAAYGDLTVKGRESWPNPAAHEAAARAIEKRLD